MPVESAQYINTLQPDWPLGTEPESAGDDHLRMIKQVLQNTFPNMNGEVAASADQANRVLDHFHYSLSGEDPNITTDFASVTNSDNTAYTPILAGDLPVATMNAFGLGTCITWGQLINLVYPVGCIYESWGDSRNPADILGFGTWTALVGYSAGVGYVTDGAGLGVTFAAGFNGGIGNWQVQHAAIAPGGYTVGVSGQTDQHLGHQHGNGISNPDNYASASGYYGIQPIADYGGGYAEGGGHNNTESLTQNSGAHIHNVSASGTVTIGSGTGDHLPPFHTTYRWRRDA